MPLVPLLPICQGRQVIAVLITKDGRVYVGSNGVMSPQDNCPRKYVGLGRGKGWEICRKVCSQFGHAEESVLKDAGEAASGAALYLIGHDTVCEHCRGQLKAAGVERIVIVG